MALPRSCRAQRLSQDAMARLTPPWGAIACPHVLLPLRQRDYRQIQVLSLLRSRSPGHDPRARLADRVIPGDRPRARSARRRVRDHGGAGTRGHGDGLPRARPLARARSGHQGAAVLARVRLRVRRALSARGPHRRPARAPQHHSDLPGRSVGPGHLFRDEVPAGRIARHGREGSEEAEPARDPPAAHRSRAARSATPRSAASSIATSSPTTSCSTSSDSRC